MQAGPGSEETGVEVWSSASWRELAVAWLDEQLAAAGLERTGEVAQPNLRPWATVLRAPTAQGPVWLKAAAPGTAFEVGLYRLLQEVVPDYVLTPIAADVTRGWIVLPDGGTPLGGRLAGPELAAALELVLPQYGQLQRDLAPEADRMLDLGVTDMRAAVMPQRFNDALEAVGGYVARRGGPDERATCRRVATLGVTVGAWCDQLASVVGSPTIDHNDLHPWNVFVSEAGDAGGPGRARFYDWGDSVVAHPFSSMLVALVFVQSDGGDDDPQLLRVRDAYLEAFSDLAPHAELVEALELACRVGKIARALTWDRTVRTLDPDEVDEEWARAPFHSLASLLDDSYLGGA